MNLLNFLMQSTGLPVDDNVAPEEETIEVQGPRGRPRGAIPNYNEAPDRPAIDPRYILNDDRIAPSRDEMKEILPREGKFGVKGTLRDILGIVGDGFLVQSGNKAVYQPRREQEQMADAMYGFTDNPLQAIERLNAAGYGKEAAELQEQYSQQDVRRGTLQSQVADRQSRQSDREFDNRDKGLNRIARWTAGGVPYNQLVKAAKGYGIEEEELQGLGITPDMTQEQRQQVGSMDMTVNQTRQLPNIDRGLDIRQQNADSARISATRPRNPPPRARADTPLEYFRSLENIPADERSQEENDWVKDYVGGNKGGRKGRAAGRSGPPPRAGQSKTTSRFRIIQ